MTTIDPLPTPPQLTDTRAVFNTRGAAFTQAMPTFGSQVNAAGAEIYANYAAILSQSGAAIAKGTSTTSLVIGTGSKVFTTQAGKGFVAGQTVICSSAANRNNWMWGVVASYASTTLTVTVSLTGGSGTLADWDLLIASPRGQVYVTDFTASGTWTKNLVARAVIVQVLGAGGGGSGCVATAGYQRGGGGGGGVYAEVTYTAEQLPDTVTVTVGAGGSGGANTGGAGGTGGTSSFGSLITAYGGGGGGVATTTGANTSNGDGGGGGAGLAAAGSGGGAIAGGNGGAGITGGTGGVGGASVGVAGETIETKLFAGGGGSAGNAYTTTTSGIAGGGAVYGGGGGGGGVGGGNGSASTTAVGGPGGLSLFGGHGGAGAGHSVATVPTPGTSGGLNSLVGTSGGSPLAADGGAGGVGCGGGGAGAGNAGVARIGGAGGRGHVRVIEFF